MTLPIRALVEDDIDAVLEVARQAWLPVFWSLERVLGTEIWRRLDEDPQGTQLKAIEDLCRDKSDATGVWVAEVPETSADRAALAGFVAYKLDLEKKQGEIWFLAVHPDYQNRGIGTALNRSALERMREAGMIVAIVETGGDPSHAPARRCYKKSGFTALPIVRYFQAL